MDFKKLVTIIFLFIAFEFGLSQHLLGLSEPEPEPQCCGGIGDIVGAVGALAVKGVIAGAVAGAVANQAYRGYQQRRPSKLIDW